MTDFFHLFRKRCPNKRRSHSMNTKAPNQTKRCAIHFWTQMTKPALRRQVCLWHVTLHVNFQVNSILTLFLHSYNLKRLYRPTLDQTP